MNMEDVVEAPFPSTLYYSLQYVGSHFFHLFPCKNISSFEKEAGNRVVNHVSLFVVLLRGCWQIGITRVWIIKMLTN